MSKFENIQQVKDWNNKWRFHKKVPLRVAIPTFHEWYYTWFFESALFDRLVATESFFVIVEFLQISGVMSREESIGTLLCNLDTWYFRGGYQCKEFAYKDFKANLTLSNPGTL